MKAAPHQLSRRERQIMDVIYKLGKATAAEIHERLPDQPTYSTVRAKLRVLEEKGFVRHQEQGPRYVFTPTTAPDKARRSALQHLVDTFFGGSAEQVVATLIDSSAAKMSDQELDRLSRMIEKARKDGL
jgi:BlaI family transcriptional regulator, penicillinase repressor